ncbi:GNAT family N-acetyltransferase [Paenibacillus tundrae]|nr:N-acetyltransferase [Paenibacillus tundrae]
MSKFSDICIERMNEDQYMAVSELLLEGFRDKFHFGTRGKDTQFAVRIACLSYRPAKGEMYIADVAVHENLRGAGVGRMMLEWVMREAASKPGIKYMSLHVSSNNIRAKHWYERLGFRTLETQRSTLMGWLLGQQEWNYMIREVS